MTNPIPNFPAFLLLMGLSLSMILGLPLLIWLFLRGNRDRGVHWWFVAIAINATALLLVGGLQRFNVISALLFVLAVLCGIESMRWELRRPPMPLRWTALAFGVYALSQLALDAAGLRMTVGFAVNLMVLNVADAVLIYLIWRVSQLHHSRGLLMVAVGIAMVLLPNIYRWLQVLEVGAGAEVFAGSTATNLSMVVLTIVLALQSVGYGGFVMEKLHRRQLAQAKAQARAQEQQRLAETHARDLEAIIAQRDDMIVLNSRFSSMSKLAVYSSAIVHEISQPLQALTSILDTLILQNTDKAPAQHQQFEHAMGMVRKMSDTLMSLRKLMGGQPVALELLSLDQVFQDILPILQTQAHRQQIILEHEPLPLNATVVNANATLLQRVIFNLVTNAFEALSLPVSGVDTPLASAPARPNQTVPRTTRKVLVQTHLHQTANMVYQVLRVEDNGPGLPEAFLQQPQAPLRTTKDQGVGLGLSIVRMIVESWGGELRTYNLPPEQGTGAVVEVWLQAQ